MAGFSLTARRPLTIWHVLLQRAKEQERAARHDAELAAARAEHEAQLAAMKAKVRRLLSCTLSPACAHGRHAMLM